MRNNKTARRSGNCARAKRPVRDADIVARDYAELSHIAGIIIGIAFGVMLFIGILAG